PRGSRSRPRTGLIPAGPGSGARRADDARAGRPARRGLPGGSAISVPSASMLPDWLTHHPIRLKVEPSTFSVTVRTGHVMSSISIIGTGNMARAIGALAVAGGNTVEVMGRDQSKAADLAKALGGSATTGEFGAVPAG